jgi:hypothetical protein
MQNMKVIGKIIGLVGMGNSHIQTVIYIKDNGVMIKLMVLEYTIMLMGLDTLGSGRMIYNMG